MQNLKYPVKKIFLPNVDIKNIKMYRDSADGRAVLHFNNDGYSIKGRAISAGTPDLPTETTIQDGLQYLAKSTTNYGQPTSVLVNFSNIATKDAGLSLSIKQKVERPGFDNGKNNTEFRSYNGYIARPTITDGLLSDANMETMKMQIMEGLKDAFVSRENIEYLSDDLASSVIARKLVLPSGSLAGATIFIKAGATAIKKLAGTTVRYPFTVATTGGTVWGEADATTGIIITEAEGIALGVDTATDINYIIGSATTIVTARDETFTKGKSYNFLIPDTLPTENAVLSLSANIFTKVGSDIKLDVAASPYALVNVGGQVYITSENDFEDFVVTFPTYTFESTLWLRGASSYVLFDVTNHESQVELEYLKVDILDSGGTNYMNTGTSTADGLVNLANVLNLATVNGENFHSLGRGKYPSLTAQRIAEEYRAYNLALTAYEAALYGQFPVVGTKYACYEICSEGEVPNLHGASHKNGYMQRVLIYVPLALAQTNYWLTPVGQSNWDLLNVDTAQTNPDSTFETILAMFSGTALTSWK